MFSILKRRKIKRIAGNIEARPSRVSILIDEQLFSILRPLNVMLTLSLSAKYKLKDNTISVNSVFYNIFSFVSLLFITVSVHYFFLSQFLTSDTSDTLSAVIFIGYTVNSVACDIGSLAFLYTNYKHRKNNMLLVLKIQNAFKNLKIDARRQIKTNWALVVALNFYYFCFDVYFSNLVQRFRIWDVLNIHLFMGFDLNVIYVSVLLNLLSHMTEEWIKEVNRSGLCGELDNKAYWMRMFNVFLDVMEAYQMIVKCFQNLVSYMVIS